MSDTNARLLVTTPDLTARLRDVRDIPEGSCDLETTDRINAGLRQAIGRLRRRKYREATYLVRDIEVSPRLEKVELFLLATGARKKRIVDLQGADIPVSWPSFLLRAPAKLALEGALSLALIAYTYARVRLLGPPVTPPGAADRVGKVAYLRTDHWFGVEAGGSVGHVAGVVAAFRNLGYRLFLLSTDRLRLIDTGRTPMTVVRPSYRFFSTLPEVPEVAYNLKLIREGTRIFREEKPDLVYQRYSRDNYAGIVLARRFRVPLIVEYNGSEVWMGKHWAGGLTFERLAAAVETANLRCASLIVVVSGEMKKELAARGVPGGKILVCPNCVDVTVFRPDADGSAVQERYGLRGKIVAGFIGTFGRWHGTDVIARAVRDVVRQNPDVHFLLIGDGAMMGPTREIVAQDGVSGHVTFTGLVPQQDAAGYLAACDILLAPTVPNPDGTPFFGSPTKLFEYMAMGKGIVASNLGQIDEIIERGRTGLLVDGGDAGQLADAIVRLAADRGLREAMGRNARAVAVEKYTWDSNVRNVMDALRVVTDERHENTG